MNYKETNITGTSWVRCNNVTITNPLNGEVPTAFFQEEKVVCIDDANTIVPEGFCCKVFDPSSGVIPLLNPVTGASLGPNVTHAELYTILYSLYVQTAMERDAA